MAAQSCITKQASIMLSDKRFIGNSVLFYHIGFPFLSHTHTISALTPSPLLDHKHVGSTSTSNLTFCVCTQTENTVTLQRGSIPAFKWTVWGVVKAVVPVNLLRHLLLVSECVLINVHFGWPVFCFLFPYQHIRYILISVILLWTQIIGRTNGNCRIWILSSCVNSSYREIWIKMEKKWKQFKFYRRNI